MDFLPPQNLEAEQSVLGAILLDSRVLPDVLEILSEGDFYREVHKKIFAAMRSLSTAGTAIDLVTVAHELEICGHLEHVGGRSYIASLASQIPTAVNAAYHAKIVKDCAIRRSILRLSQDVQSAVYENAEIPELLSMLSSASIDDGQSDIVTVGQLLQELDNRNAPDYKKPDMIGTGFINLDTLIGGFEYGDLVILAGRPSMGKSAVALNWASWISQDHPTHVVSIEMTNLAMVARLAAGICGIPAKAIRRGEVYQANYNSLFGAIRELNNHKLTFDERATKLSQIESSYLRAVRQGIKVVIIDHLHIVDNHMAGRSKVDEVAEVTKTLKRLAKRTQTVCVALAQLNRGVEGREIKEPVLSDLRASGAIEQDADLVIGLHRPGYYDKGRPDDEIKLVVLKNREGETGSVVMGWDGKRTKAVERG